MAQVTIPNLLLVHLEDIISCSILSLQDSFHFSILIINGILIAKVTGELYHYFFPIDPFNLVYGTYGKTWMVIGYSTTGKIVYVPTLQLTGYPSLTCIKTTYLCWEHCFFKLHHHAHQMVVLSVDITASSYILLSLSIG